MQKLIKNIPQVLGWMLAGYVLFFFAWLFLVTDCVQENRDGCGDNTMTDIVRVAYAPIIKLVVR